jgi:hypothetical protein
MKTYTKEELSEVLRLHGLWLRDEGGEQADLSGADLSGADLSGANLSGADLSWADLSGADLSGADLSGANLSWANLKNTKLSNNEYLVKSIFINGSRHSVSWWGLGMISIGCHRKEIKWWKKNYRAVGENEDYTPEQIDEYYQYILICERMQKSLKS